MGILNRYYRNSRFCWILHVDSEASVLVHMSHLNQLLNHPCRGHGGEVWWCMGGNDFPSVLFEWQDTIVTHSELSPAVLWSIYEDQSLLKWYGTLYASTRQTVLMNQYIHPRHLVLQYR